MLPSVADKEVINPLKGLRIGARRRQMAWQHGKIQTRLWGTAMFAPSYSLGEAIVTSRQAGLA